MEAIKKFSGKYSFLSNFYPCFVIFDGERYASVEDAYQAAKTFDSAERARIRCANSPSEAKRLGQQVTLRSDWEYVKDDIMKMLLSRKFDRADLKAALLGTGDAELVEGNTWGDTYWGVCNGQGENHLGELLMSIRTCLREGESIEYNICS